MKKINFLSIIFLFSLCSNSNYSTDNQSNWCVAKADLISYYTLEGYTINTFNMPENQFSIKLDTLRWKNSTPEDVPVIYSNYLSAKDIYKTSIIQDRFQKDEYLKNRNPEYYSRADIFFNGDLDEMKLKNKTFHEDTNYSVRVFTPLIDGERQEVEATYNKYNNKFGTNWGAGTELAFFSYLVKDRSPNSLELCKIWEELSY